MGRVQAADVLAAATARPAEAPAPMTPAAIEPLADEIIPLVGMRRTIAERLTLSYQTIPHITLTVRVDMTGFNAARTELNAHAQGAGLPKISVTALLVKAVAHALRRNLWLNSSLVGDEIRLRQEINLGVAVAHALRRNPWLNSSLVGDEIRLQKEINLGVAVALESGLIVPVVRQADRKGVAALAAEIDDLAARARAGRLVPADVSGGTFTISNLGPFGIEQFTAIINPPQTAILAVGATQLEAVPQEDGQLVARPVMRLTLSADHRVVDGAVAAQFLGDLKAALTTPTLMLL